MYNQLKPNNRFASRINGELGAELKCAYMPAIRTGRQNTLNKR
jgi:hypothetical protein